MTTKQGTLWSATEVAQATGAQTKGSWVAGSVSIDSRTIAPQGLFVAIVGERFDGHEFVAEVLQKGAAGAIVSRIPKGLEGDDRLVLVENTEVALRDLGVAGRKRCAAKVVGVTGSVGKTGAKEMLRVALSAVGKTYATQGNLNNHLGVPLNLANLPADVDYAIFERGMNHAGEIRQLTHWVQPHASIITTVEPVHIEFFDSVEGIADAKAEIFEGMGGEGIAVINADNPYYKRIHDAATKAGLDRILTFGVGAKALCRMQHYATEGFESVVDATIAGTPVRYRLGAIGKHWGLMSVAVLAVVEGLGADLPKAAAALAQFSEPAGRGKIEELKVKGGGHLRLIDDAYNASPASMAAAFEKMSLIADGYEERPRTIAVLGDMLELGDHSIDLHVGLVPTLVNNHIDLVFAAGSFMRYLYEALPEEMRGDYDITAAGLAPKVVDRLQAQDLVLVKGSNGSRMREVVRAIRDAGE